MTDKTERAHSAIDPLDPARAAALHATLDRPGPVPANGSPLPPFWHWIYFWDAQPPAKLGRDGHPKVGGFIPDTGLPRRMWAGGKLDFIASPVLGVHAERISTVTEIDRKEGRTGPLALVTVTHELWQNDTLCLQERQDLIYREDPDPAAPQPTPKQAPTDEIETRQVSFAPLILFRYSALTFNGHRIHYDRDYCRKVEGYPGLVVHGPLLAKFLIHFAEDLLGSLGQFSFRATAPLFDFETATLCARQDDNHLTLWVKGPDGRQCMIATATA